ncbi:hypothetical protein DWW02_25080 [Enterocloster bolteae]|uniref:Uncharacterized protein n=1 Tax=Enterocloster bolteae TaxID=208479 RepID=A0A412YXF0_9FIRM|nr:hypothetical protein DWW02_25080 [Enterocloster bolteae]
MTRTYQRQFNLHKTNAANEELVISLNYGREVQERRPIYRLLQHCNSLSNKMDNSLLAVRDINHKYIVVGKGQIRGTVLHGFLLPQRIRPDLYGQAVYPSSRLSA